MYTVSQKTCHRPYFCPYLRHILTDFKNSFTGALCEKFAIGLKWLLIIPPHLNSIATLPCETLMSVKLAITAFYIVRAHSDFSDTSESSDKDRSRWSVQQWIDCVRPVSLDTWRVERCVCGWSSWLNSSLLTVVSGHVLFSTPMLRSATPVPSVGAFRFRIVFSKLLNALWFHFISTNSVSILHKPYSLNWCKF